MRLTATTVGAVLAAALVVPAAAGAATAEVAPFVPKVVYRAAPGETNRLTSTVPTGGLSVTLTDAGAPLTPGAGCVVVDAHTVTCTRDGGFLLVEADLGDGDDEAAATGPVTFSASGGPGDDVLRGGEIFDSLNGGGGTDTLLGNGGDDVLSDGDTDDVNDADVLDGGPGPDRVLYNGRTAGVTIDLSGTPTSGAKGEGDRVIGVEAAEGGSGDDRLLGSDGDDELSGGEGDDVLKGRAGDDQLYGSEGDDSLAGSDGDDLLIPGEGRDRLSCGAGTDDVDSPEEREVVSPRCETITYPLPDDPTVWVIDPEPPTVGRRQVRIDVGCGQHAADDPTPLKCRGRVQLREATGRKRLLGRATFSGKEGAQARRPLIRLNATGRALLARKRGVRGTVFVRGFNLRSIAWSLDLRR